MAAMLRVLALAAALAVAEAAKPIKPNIFLVLACVPFIMPSRSVLMSTTTDVPRLDECADCLPCCRATAAAATQRRLRVAQHRVAQSRDPIAQPRRARRRRHQA